MDHQPKFFENLSGTGKAIGVLTSGGDAQGGYGGPGETRKGGREAEARKGKGSGEGGGSPRGMV